MTERVGRLVRSVPTSPGSIVSLVETPTSVGKGDRRRGDVLRDHQLPALEAPRDLRVITRRVRALRRAGGFPILPVRHWGPEARDGMFGTRSQ